MLRISTSLSETNVEIWSELKSGANITNAIPTRSILLWGYNLIQYHCPYKQLEPADLTEWGNGK